LSSAAADEERSDETDLGCSDLLGNSALPTPLINIRLTDLANAIVSIGFGLVSVKVGEAFPDLAHLAGLYHSAFHLLLLTVASYDVDFKRDNSLPL